MLLTFPLPPGDGGPGPRDHTGPTRRRVTLVSQHALIADALQVALSVHSQSLSWVDPTPVDGAHSVTAAVTRTAPAVVLVDTDVRLPSGPAELIRQVTRSRVPVVALTPYADEREAGRLLAHGAVTAVSKQVALSDLTDVVRRLQQGQRVLDAAERARLVLAWEQHESDDDRCRNGLARLSPREEVVLTGLMAGRTVSGLAADEHVSVETIRSQVKSILAKLGVGNQVAAVGVAYRAAWQPRHAVTERRGTALAAGGEQPAG